MKRVVDGAEHAKLVIRVAVPLAMLIGAVGAVHFHSPVPLAIVPGALMGLILDPDLDQRMITYSEYHIGRIPVIGWLWIAWCFGYSMCFNQKGSRWLKHRGLSHLPVLGTFTRVLWFWGPALAAIAWANLYVDHLLLAWLFLGLCMADFTHIYRDLTTGKNGRKPLSNPFSTYKAAK